MADQDDEDLLPLPEEGDENPEDSEEEEEEDDDEDEEEDDDEDEEEEEEGLFVEDPINDVLAVCGATVAQQKAMRLEGFSTLEDFLVIRPTAIDKMISAMSKRGTPAGATIGIVLATKLQALVYWCRECKRNGQSLDSRAFTHEVLEEALERLELEGSKVDSPPDLLPKEKFDPLKWVSWYERVTNHLSQLKGHNGVALSYVVR